MDLGVEGLDPPTEHFGRTGHLRHLEVGDARVGELGRRVPAGHELPPEAGQAGCQIDQAILVIDRQQGPHVLISVRTPLLCAKAAAVTTVPRPSIGPAADLPSGFELAQGPGHRGRVEVPLHDLDALVQSLLGVARQYGDGFLGQDRAGVHGEGGEVHRASGLGHPGGQGVADAVPAGESG